MPATPASLPITGSTADQDSAFLRRILATWWPLAASWMLMGAELPVVSAVVARLADPEINLAAYGGIVMPLALIIESPIIMLLSASTALSKDWASFARMRRFMMSISAVLTALHVLVVFTPLYDVIARNLLGAPAEIIEPGRMGLRIMLPWTWSIAYRRFHQGVLIRFGRSGTVGRGTLIRLGANCTVLIIGYLIGSLPGIVVAASAVATGVVSEALYVAIAVRPVLHGPLRQAQPVDPPLTWGAFFAFYLPLVMTSLIGLLASPLNSAALGRMPRSLESLAAWPAISGLVFLLRSPGIAYNEVVVSMLDEPHSSSPLRRFMVWMVVLTSAIIVLITITPLSTLWFGRISALKPESGLPGPCGAVVRPAPAGDERAAVLVPGRYLAQQAHARADRIGGGLPADRWRHPVGWCSLGENDRFLCGLAGLHDRHPGADSLAVGAQPRGDARGYPAGSNLNDGTPQSGVLGFYRSRVLLLE